MAYSEGAPRAATPTYGAARADGFAMPRRRGVLAGMLLLLLGIWGGIIPFVGPYFGYQLRPGGAWGFTWDYLWLNILPAAAVVFGALLLMGTANRAIGALGAWLALAGGAWFVVGPSFNLLWNPGGPIVAPGASGAYLFIVQIGYFYGLGAIIIALAAFLLARVVTVSRRDMALLDRSAEPARYAERPAGEPVEPARYAERPAAEPARYAERPAGEPLEPARAETGTGRAVRVDPSGTTFGTDIPDEGYPPRADTAGSRAGRVDPSGTPFGTDIPDAVEMPPDVTGAPLREAYPGPTVAESPAGTPFGTDIPDAAPSLSGEGSAGTLNPPETSAGHMPDQDRADRRVHITTEPGPATPAVAEDAHQAREDGWQSTGSEQAPEASGHGTSPGRHWRGRRRREPAVAGSDEAPRYHGRTEPPHDQR